MIPVTDKHFHLCFLWKHLLLTGHHNFLTSYFICMTSQTFYWCNNHFFWKWGCPFAQMSINFNMMPFLSLCIILFWECFLYVCYCNVLFVIMLTMVYNNKQMEMLSCVQGWWLVHRHSPGIMVKGDTAKMTFDAQHQLLIAKFGGILTRPVWKHSVKIHWLNTEISTEFYLI